MSKEIGVAHFIATLEGRNVLEALIKEHKDKGYVGFSEIQETERFDKADADGKPMTSYSVTCFRMLPDHLYEKLPELINKYNRIMEEVYNNEPDDSIVELEPREVNEILTLLNYAYDYVNHKRHNENFTPVEDFPLLSVVNETPEETKR